MGAVHLGGSGCILQSKLLDNHSVTQTQQFLANKIKTATKKKPTWNGKCGSIQEIPFFLRMNSVMTINFFCSPQPNIGTSGSCMEKTWKHLPGMWASLTISRPGELGLPVSSRIGLLSSRWPWPEARNARATCRTPKDSSSLLNMISASHLHAKWMGRVQGLWETHSEPPRGSRAES